MSLLRRPTYTTTLRVSYADWLRANDDDLRDWYRVTSEWAPEQHQADFADFCAVQFDLACEEDERFDDEYEARCNEADAEDEPVESGLAWEQEDANLYRPGRD